MPSNCSLMEECDITLCSLNRSINITIVQFNEWLAVSRLSFAGQGKPISNLSVKLPIFDENGVKQTHPLRHRDSNQEKG
jgi:hypothetical protein